VTVNVDESRRDRTAARIDLSRRRSLDRAESADSIAFDREVARYRRSAAAVVNRRVANHHVPLVLGHRNLRQLFPPVIGSAKRPCIAIGSPRVFRI